MALWTGRLACADPAWTPARRPSDAVRDPASLVPGGAELTEIASAMHYTADSLARAARTDLDTAAAGTAGRLYVTTRSLPAHYDVPRPYADAPATDRRQTTEDRIPCPASTITVFSASIRGPPCSASRSVSCSESRPGSIRGFHSSRRNVYLTL